MVDPSLVSDDPGTILDSFEHVLPAIPAIARVLREDAPVVKELPYRSPYRWAAPRLLICDDGSLDEGELVYVRTDRIVIGRTKGDIVIRHDAAMSGSHAEIVREPHDGEPTWILRDLGSSNGTLARVSAAFLRPGMTLLIGSKRYRFEVPAAEVPPITGESVTALYEQAENSSTMMAMASLVEVPVPGGAPSIRHRIRSARASIGRPGYGNEVEIDDPCLAATHAVISREGSGAWKLEATKSLNGVWVRVASVKATNDCWFQCGEQRFRFRL